VLIPPGNIEVFSQIDHYHYCRQGLEKPCTVLHAVHSFPLRTIGLANSWGVNIIPLTNVAYGYKSLINNRTLNLLNRKKGLSLIKSLHILWPRELFEFKRIYIQLSISHQYFEILRPVPNWYTTICPQTYYQLFQEVNSFPRASGNRCNTWLPQTTRFKIS